MRNGGHLSVAICAMTVILRICLMQIGSWKSTMMDLGNSMIRQYLEMWVDLEKSQSQHSDRVSIHNFVLVNGQSFPTTPDTFSGPRMEAKMCFMNATHLALAKSAMIYCEGYVEIYGIAINHAWCVSQQGKVIDPTMTQEPNDRIGEYYGIPFKTDYLQKSIVKNGYYGLLGFPEAKKTLLPLLKGT